VEGLKAELSDYADDLEWRDEFLLNKDPQRIDVIVIKKKTDKPIRKRIGQIFRKYNVVEYKSEKDSLSVNSFNRVCGYAFQLMDMYKGDPTPAPSNLTLTFVVYHHPREVIEYCRKELGCKADLTRKDVFCLNGWTIPIQVINCKKLSAEDSDWIRNLRSDIEKFEELKSVIDTAGKRHNIDDMRAYLAAVVSANAKKFEKELKAMYMSPELIEIARTAKNWLPLREGIFRDIEEPDMFDFVSREADVSPDVLRRTIRAMITAEQHKAGLETK